jgi:hypothetical protein
MVDLEEQTMLNLPDLPNVLWLMYGEDEPEAPLRDALKVEVAVASHCSEPG